MRLSVHDRQVLEASMRRRPYPGTPRITARPLGARPRVALQVGHWKMDELPPDLYRLRGNTGAAWGPYREVDLNLKIAELTAEILRAEGVEVEILPGAVPADYLADAFVAIHADGAWRPGARGWKTASAWRASEASRRLERSVADSYASTTGLPEDRAGITFGMKGYYAFSRHRYSHALSPFTPAIIIETGFITDARDREVLINRTSVVAWGIASGVLRFLGTHTALDWKKLVPRYYPFQRVGETSAQVYAFPNEHAPLREVLEPGTLVSPVHRVGEWVEIVVRGNYRVFGWVREDQLAPLI
jgi:N-acetylmuramoyl-L-alanine amidase